MTISQSLRNWLKSLQGRLPIAIMSCIALLVFGSAGHAQDVKANCRNAASCLLTPNGGIPWANGNLTFIFDPIAPHASIYIYLHNNNPSNAHTSQSVQVFQTPFVSAAAPSLSLNSDRWVQDTVTQNSTPGASCNNLNANSTNAPGAVGLGSCYVMATFASQIAIRITGAAAQAGSPDTYDLVIVQEPSQMGSASPGSAPSGLTSPSVGPAATLPIQVISDTLSQAFISFNSVTNPGAAVISELTANNGTRSLYPDKLIITSTAAATVSIQTFTACTGSCTGTAITNLKPGSAITSTAGSNNGSGALTSQTLVFQIVLPANQTIIIDMRGFVFPAGTTTGVDLLNTAGITGTITESMLWYEK